ncbi:DUF389 domain-containing protein [Kitasatospora paranensis]|uniref:DUF389 domain-containing protein n=1 Tax=Kitasatospora paranensis TaxID=258053 RepID=A0ABW2G027_9ACTN
MEMIHVRLVVPPELAEETVRALAADRFVFNLVVLPGAARNPDGDAVTCDVLTGAANDTLGRLRALAVERHGSIVVEPVEMALSDTAAAAESHRLGALAHAPVWEEVEARIRAEGSYRPSFYLYLVVAGLIGSVGILTNSQILIVAAMVVGPEYGAITSVALGLERHSRGRVRRGLVALAVGFTLAIVATFLFTLLVRALDLQPPAFERGLRPVSDLIDAPDFFSVVVAVLAGIIGIVSLTEARTSALLGVFISVTTIPAAADVGVSCAFASFHEAGGSLLQLLLNIVVLVAMGVVTLKVQRAVWRGIGRRIRPARGV